MFNMEKFAALLSRKRREKGLTQDQLSNLVGVTHQAVSKWERGEAMPEISKIGDIAKAIDTPADELINSLYEGEVEARIFTEPENMNSADEAYFALADKTRVGDIYALAPKMSKDVLHLAIDTLVATNGGGAATMLFRFADREYLSNLGAILFANGDTRLAEYVDESIIQGAVVDLITKAEVTPHHPEKSEYFTKIGQLLTYCHEIEFVNDVFDRMIASFGNWDIWRGFIGRFPSDVVVHQGVKIATRLGPNCFFTWWEIIGRRNIAKIFIGYIENFDKNNYRAWQDVSRFYGYADGSIMEKYIKERLTDDDTDSKLFEPLCHHLSTELKTVLSAKRASEHNQNELENYSNSHESDGIEDVIMAKIAEEVTNGDLDKVAVLIGVLSNVKKSEYQSNAGGGPYESIIEKLNEVSDMIADLESRIDDLESRIDDWE